MITYEQIRAALDAADLRIIPGTRDNWIQFDYCGLTIHIWNQNGTSKAFNDEDAAINVYSSSEATDLILDQLESDSSLRFYDYFSYNPIRESIDAGDLSDRDVLHYLNKIQKLCWLRPMKLINQLHGERAAEFAKHPTFLIRQDPNSNRLYFLDSETRENFWISTSAMKSEFHSNGYARTVTRSGAVYETELA